MSGLKQQLCELGDEIDRLLNEGQLFRAIELNYEARALLCRIMRMEGIWS